MAFSCAAGEQQAESPFLSGNLREDLSRHWIALLVVWISRFGISSYCKCLTIQAVVALQGQLPEELKLELNTILLSLVAPHAMKREQAKACTMLQTRIPVRPAASPFAWPD